MSGFAHPCPNCGCSNCCTTCPDGGPDQLQVVISGYTDGGCSNCDEGYNGTFVLERYCGSCRNAIGDDESVTICGWIYTFSPACLVGFAVHNALMVTFQDGGSGTTVIRVKIMIGAQLASNCGASAEWTVTDTLPACQSLEDYEVPFFEQFNHMENGTTCNFDGSSVFLTAL
jgi:hypothetical protein